MNILAIETSCDDTCIAILKSKINRENFEILSNIVSSQVKIHAKYGGVFPSLAKREHQKNLPVALRKALKVAENPKIDVIAVTVGPGLEPCLWTGINFAKELAEKMNLPIIPVNHIEAHILANFIGGNPRIFPAICLVVSGGHTQLILMKGIGKYRILGETRDDAAGECFDKVARILGLGYPGGPIIAVKAAEFRNRASITEFSFMGTRWKKKAEPSSPYNSKSKNIRSSLPFVATRVGEEEDEVLFAYQKSSKQSLRDATGQVKFKIKLPRPMLNTKDYDFSFSGLKTAVLYLVKNLKSEKKLTKKKVQEICFESQQSIIDVLIKKTMKAAKDFKAKTVILGGGVAANEELKGQLKQKIEKEIPRTKYLVPSIGYCTDNAVMTAITAYFQWLKEKTKTPHQSKARYGAGWKKMIANANLRIDKNV